MGSLSNRGGSRKGAGRPSGWASGCKFEDTKLIRVPKAIADKVLDAAHKIDVGESFEPIVQPIIDPLEEPKQLTLLKDGSTFTIEVPIQIAAGVQLVVKQMVSSLEHQRNSKNKLGLVCPSCGANTIRKHGKNSSGNQVYQCRVCRRRFLSRQINGSC